MKQEYYTKYWGKFNKNATGDEIHLLVWHCLDVAAAGSVLTQRDSRLYSMFYSHPLFKENPGLLSFLLAVHDAGKFSKGFQEKIQMQVDNGAGHTAESFALLMHELKKGALKDFLAKNIQNPAELRVITAHLEIFLEASAGHHGKPVSADFQSIETPLLSFGNENKSDAADFILELADKFLSGVCVPPALSADKKFWKSTSKNLSWVFAGLCVTSDWVASNKDSFKWLGESKSLETYWSDAVFTAESVLPKTGLIPSPASGLVTVEQLFGFAPRHLQKVIDELKVQAGPNLYIIEESTGGGKTEASLTLTEKLLEAGCGDGFYFALPTMATANAMFERIAGDSRLYEKFFTGDLPVSVVLSHGQKILSERYADFLSKYRAADDIGWMYDTNKKAILSLIGVGTIDQILMGVLPFKHQSLRLLGCARNILIIDEVHAYDTYMNTLIETLLKFHKACGGSVILLSATLPKNLKQKFLDIYAPDTLLSEKSAHYPLITHAGGDGSLSEIYVPPSADKFVSVRLEPDADAVISELISAAEKGGCACYVCNTVADAVNAYSLLKNHTEYPVHLFHARFTMGDRLMRENEVLRIFGKSSKPEDRAGHILVATQVVEQSLDLDFDFMVSDLAPVDLLIQRAGRLWRHLRTRPAGFVHPEFVVHSPVPKDGVSDDWYASMFPGGAYVYPEHGRLWLTAKVLSDAGGFAMPKDARYLIDTVYSDDESGVPEILQKRDAAEKEKNKISDGHARRVALDIAGGYCAGQNIWSNEEPALTREGERSVQLELYRVSSGGKPVLWSGESGERGQLMSRISVSASVLNKRIKNTLTVDDTLEYTEPLKVILTNSELHNIWIPKEGIFQSELAYYSEVEGLVLPKQHNNRDGKPESRV